MHVGLSPLTIQTNKLLHLVVISSLNYSEFVLVLVISIITMHIFLIVWNTVYTSLEKKTI